MVRPRPRTGDRRHPALWLLVLLAPWLVACPAPEPPEEALVLEDLGSGLVFDGPLLVVPGTRWATTELEGDVSGAEGWVFRSFARLLCDVKEAPEESLRLHLRANESTADHRFEVRWDDTVVAPETIARDGRDFEITIPRTALAPGLHQLVIRRLHPPGTRMDSVDHDNVFESLAWSLADGRFDLETGDRQRGEHLAEFLLHGVTGDGIEQRGGFLFVDPRSHRLPLTDGGGRLSFEPFNLSQHEARFRLTAGGEVEEVVVAAGGRGSVEMALPAETRGLDLEVVAEEGAGPFLWGVPALRRASEERPPSIVLVTLDTTRRDALDPYRGQRPADLTEGLGVPSDLAVTPNIGRWAEGATVFEQAFSTSPWTLPSHASIFTGLYPSRHRAGTRDVQLPTGAVTLASLLRQQGYVTLGVSAGELSSSRFGLAQGFHSYRNPDQFETLGDRVDAAVGELLDRHADVPFFLWINYFDPHALYRAPEEYDDRFEVEKYLEQLPEGSPWAELADGKMASWRAAVEGDLAVTPEAIEYLKAAYLAEVAWTDHLIGRLFDRLEDRGLLDDSLVILTADHGELLGEGGYVSHGARLDPELVEIPMIVRWPGQTEGGRDGRLVSLVDLFPTVLAAAGIEAPASDGHLLEAGSDDPLRRFAVLEEHEFLVHPLPKFMKVARSLYGVQRPQARRLVWEGGEECAQLVDGHWQTAPCETPRESVLSSLEELLGHSGEPHAAEGVELSDAEREGLEALGYL